MSYRDHVIADLRLVILRLLSESSGYELNSSVLQMAASDYGHEVSRDTLHSELQWLSEQGLVTLREIATVRVAVLTARGADVAEGRASTPGVKRPGPGG